MRNFSELTDAQREQIRGRFILPEDETGILVNEHMVPLKRIPGLGMVGFTVINNNFHVHGNKQNNRS